MIDQEGQTYVSSVDLHQRCPSLTCAPSQRPHVTVHGKDVTTGRDVEGS